jgi:hypothetical protein
MKLITRRKILGNMLALGLFVPLFACGEGKQKGSLFMKKEIVLDVVLYSYLNRPIFDIYLNGTDLGVANSYGGTGIVTSVSVPLGSQTLTWRDAGSGETFAVKNSLNLAQNQITPGSHYLGVHIYPDHTAEFTFSEHMPETTPRGHHIIEESKRHGK